MTRYKLTLEYDGRGFVGWQRQDNGPSIQQALEDAIERFSGERVAVTGAGRTDAGVHALGQVAHFDLAAARDPDEVFGALNHHLKPAAIAVLAAEAADDDFHARFSALGRRYRYRIVNRRAPLTHELGLAWQVPQALDEAAMAEAAARLVGRHDFTTFRSVHCQADSPVRTLDLLSVERDGARLFIRAAARSFLHHQVRSMVGCLALVGMGRWTPDDVEAALVARDRAQLGLNAPSDGLFFVRADYPDEG